MPRRDDRVVIHGWSNQKKSHNGSLATTLMVSTTANLLSRSMLPDVSGRRSYPLKRDARAFTDGVIEPMATNDHVSFPS